MRAISAQPHSAWLSEEDLRWILKEGIDLDRTLFSARTPHCATQPPSFARYGAACTARRPKRVSTFSVQSSSQACAGGRRRAVGHVGICSRCAMVLTLCCGWLVLQPSLSSLYSTPSGCLGSHRHSRSTGHCRSPTSERMCCLSLARIVIPRCILAHIPRRNLAHTPPSRRSLTRLARRRLRDPL